MHPQIYSELLNNDPTAKKAYDMGYSLGYRLGVKGFECYKYEDFHFKNSYRDAAYMGLAIGHTHGAMKFFESNPGVVALTETKQERISNSTEWNTGYSRGIRGEVECTTDLQKKYNAAQAKRHLSGYIAGLSSFNEKYLSPRALSLRATKAPLIVQNSKKHQIEKLNRRIGEDELCIKNLLSLSEPKPR